MFEFDAGVGCCEVPVGFGVVGVSVVFPAVDFVDEGLLIRDAAIEALDRLNAEFGLCQIEPTGYVGV